MGSIFGGSKSKSKQTSVQSSSNLAYPAISSAFLPEATNSFQRGAQALQAGLAGGYEEYRKNTGTDFWKNMGLRKTAGTFSGRGLYNTGATMKALSNYDRAIESAAYNDYLAQQAVLAQLGLQAGGLVSSTGNVSSGQSQGTSTGKSSPGLGGFVGNLIGGAAASDERLKTDITKIGEHSGLGVYEFTYINGAGPYVGVMAQEVAEKYPEALGPVREGYLTVNYTKLQELAGSFKNAFSD